MWDKIISYLIGRMIKLGKAELDITRFQDRELAENIKIFEGRPSWLEGKVDPYGDPRQTVNYGPQVVDELARLTTIELESEIKFEEGDEKGAYLNEQYQRVINGLNSDVEYAIAKGEVIFKPFFENGQILVETIQPENFAPLRVNSAGMITEASFIDVIYSGKKIFTRIETHEMLDDNEYVITNEAWVSNTGSSESKKIPLNSVKDWEKIFPYKLITGPIRPLFSVFKMPFTNNANPRSIRGASIFSDIMKSLKDADVMNNEIESEYYLTRAMNIASIDYFKNSELTGVSQEVKDRFIIVDETGVLKQFAPTIRDASMNNRMQDIRRSIEFGAGLSFGTLSKQDIVTKTAEEIKFGKQRSAVKVKSIQDALELALVDLAIVMNEITYAEELFLSDEKKAMEEHIEILKLEEVMYKPIFEFDDSIIIDKKSEMVELRANLAITMEAIGLGLIGREHFIMEKYGISQEEAIAMLPGADPVNPKQE